LVALPGRLLSFILLRGGLIKVFISGKTAGPG
jgi:hypothetical protein